MQVSYFVLPGVRSVSLKTARIRPELGESGFFSRSILATSFRWGEVGDLTRARWEILEGEWDRDRGGDREELGSAASFDCFVYGQLKTPPKDLTNGKDVNTHTANCRGRSVWRSSDEARNTVRNAVHKLVQRAAEHGMLGHGTTDGRVVSTVLK